MTASILALIKQALGAVGTIASGVLTRKAAEAQAKSEAKIARMKAEVDWDNNQVHASTRSWKDEFHVVFLAAPVGAVFVPALQPYIKGGFEALSASVPEWWIAAFLTSIAASFGVRELSKRK